MRRFHLQRDEDVSGLSGTGIVAEGILFTDDIAVVHWLGGFPTSVVIWNDRGMESIVTVHGHEGKTHIKWLDE